MASTVFNVAKQGNFDFVNDTIKTALIKQGSTINIDADTVAAVLAGSVSGAADECDATNYARGTLAGKSVTIDDTADKAVFNATDTTYTSLGGASNNTIMGELIYKEVTNDADSIPLFFVEYAVPVTTDGNNFVSQYHASGIAENA